MGEGFGSAQGSSSSVNIDSLDGDHLDVDFTPSNYTPDASPAEAGDVDDLAAHLKGIDTALASAGGGTVEVDLPVGAGVQPASNYATWDTRNNHLVADFDDSTDESLEFSFRLPTDYDGSSSLTVTLYWAATSATTGDVVWAAQFEVLDSQDLDADGFATAQSASAATTNGTSGVLTATSITFTNAQAASPAAGSRVRLKVIRDADNAADDMTGDAELWGVLVKSA